MKIDADILHAEIVELNHCNQCYQTRLEELYENERPKWVQRSQDGSYYANCMNCEEDRDYDKWVDENVKVVNCVVFNGEMLCGEHLMLVGMLLQKYKVQEEVEFDEDT